MTKHGLWRTLGTAAATGSLALLAVSANAASAATGVELTVGSPTGPAVNVGDGLAANLASPLAITTPSGNVTCTQGGLSGVVTGNPAEGGTAEATGSITSIHAVPASCQWSIFGIEGIQSVDLAQPATLTAIDEPDDAALTAKVTNVDARLVLDTLLGTVTCDYGSSLTGTLSNADHSATFTNAPVTRLSGSSVCPATAQVSAVLAPIVDTSQGDQAVFLN